MLARQNVFFYQHNLAEQTYVNNLFYLSWNIAFGYQLSLNGPTAASNNTWFNFVAGFQNQVLFQFVSDNIVDFVVLETIPTGQSAVTLTTFATHTVLFNQLTNTAWNTNAGSVCAQGFILESDTVNAGSYCGVYNGAALSPGAHILIVEQPSASTVAVWQGYGADTDIVVATPFVASSSVTVQAETMQGTLIPVAYQLVSASSVSFTYNAVLSGSSIAKYIVSA
jgi:hypothetical protein